MGRVTIVYAPDSNTSGSVQRPTSHGAHGYEESRSGGMRREGPGDYKNVLKPKKGPGRMQYNPNIPKTLTPKGYAKLKLMMSVADKQYETLIRRLKRQGKLWEDPDFPATDSSIGIPDKRGQFDWKRPKDINPGAEFFTGGVSRFDIEQGALGDCWLLAVVSSISSYPQLFNHVVPHEQNIQSEDYVGVFQFRFWRFGQWVQVLVDDRLPVHRGSNRLAFMHSSDDTEFWSALMEKAYAKLNGCYEHLSGGSQSEAMEDLTGGICETVTLTKPNCPPDLEEQMMAYVKRCCLMGCSLDSSIVEQKLTNGLIGGHAYSVTGVHMVTYRGRKQCLVRCRNPWGGQYEWKGAWADNSAEWNDISQSEKKELQLKFSSDGEFWMAIEDFTRWFTRLEVCHLGLESLEHDQDFRGKRRLEETVFSGQWEKNISAGGCMNNRATFYMNPQFRFTVTDPDPDDNEHKTNVVIGLMQSGVRAVSGANFESIGFMVYKVDANTTSLLTRAQLLTRAAIGRSAFSNTREVTLQIKLPVGDYVIIPSTFEANKEAKFIVRVFCQTAMKECELDDENLVAEIPDDVEEAVQEENLILNEDEAIEAKFLELQDPKTKAINAIKLRELLNGSTLQDVNGFEGFNKEMCRSMVASVDHNLTGLVELPECMSLWQRMKRWKNIFFKHDVDHSGYFAPHEFREALITAGFKVSNKVFNALVHRYEDPDSNRMHFEDFILCCIRLNNVFETAGAQPKSFEGAPTFHLDDYLRMSAYT